MIIPFILFLLAIAATASSGIFSLVFVIIDQEPPIWFSDYNIIVPALLWALTIPTILASLLAAIILPS